MLSQVKQSIGVGPLNEFCREIVRGALLECGKMKRRPPPAGMRVQSGMDTVLEKLQERADAIASQREDKGDPSQTPVEIEIRRAAALMHLYLGDPNGSALEQLGDAVELARRYYGNEAQIVRDMQVILEQKKGELARAGGGAGEQKHR